MGTPRITTIKMFGCSTVLPQISNINNSRKLGTGQNSSKLNGQRLMSLPEIIKACINPKMDTRKQHHIEVRRAVRCREIMAVQIKMATVYTPHRHHNRLDTQINTIGTMGMGKREEQEPSLSALIVMAVPDYLRLRTVQGRRLGQYKIARPTKIRTEWRPMLNYGRVRISQVSSY